MKTRGFWLVFRIIQLYKMNVAWPGQILRPCSGVIAVVFSTTLAVSWSHATDSNDFFANAIMIRGATNLTASNVGATDEPGEPFHASEPAAHSLWWRWTVPATGTYSVSTSNSTFDTVLSVYVGDAVSNLSAVVINDDNDIAQLWSRVVFRAYAGETFQLAVDGVAGAAGTIRLGITPVLAVMPPWHATMADGESLYSTNFAGQALLVDFWETTCGPCVAELPDLIDIHATFKPRGFSMVGVAVDSSIEVIREFVGDHLLNYPVTQTNPEVVAALGGTVGMPTKYLVDQEGRIAGRFLGGHSLSFYEGIVSPLLRASPDVRLAIARLGGSVRISWPVTETVYEVQFLDGFPGASWVTMDGPMEKLNGRNVITIPINEGTRFFRLQKF